MLQHVEIFPWNVNFESGIAEIDEQHKVLVRLLNELVGHLAYQAEAPALNKVFDELKAYTAYHFKTEEKIWHEYFRNDPWEEWHKKAHEDFIGKILEIKRRETPETVELVIEEIVSFLTHWLAMHIIESDKRMAKVVLALPSGISLESAKEMANQEMSGATRVLIDTVMGMYDKLANRTIQMTREIGRRTKVEQELRETQAALLRLKDEAIAANVAKTSFLANMSHELRTPLNGIMGMIGLARQRMTDPQGQEQLAKAQLGADHLLMVINDVLDLSKIEANRLDLDTAPFRLASVFEAANSMVGYRARAKGLDFRIELAPEIAGQGFIGDPLRLGQILINLSGNAVKFTDSGHVTLRCGVTAFALEDAVLRFEVEDTGIGIAEEDQGRLFEAFEQADTSITRKYGGTGLGLAISSNLVRLMGGEIGIRSTPGAGSTFWFEIRLLKNQTPEEKETALPGAGLGAAAAELLSRHGGRRVLVAEDEDINQEVAKCLLEDVGLVVEVVDDGAAALEAAGLRAYDLILMDMQMPRLNGVDAALGIRNQSLNRGTPILAMTANAFAEDRARCIEAGMNDHIAKPVEPEVLYGILLRWLDRQ